MKKGFQKAFGLVLSITLLANTIGFGPVLSAAEEPSKNTTLSPFLVHSEEGTGEVDLTLLGGIDWLYPQGEQIERKADVSPVLQMTVGDDAEDIAAVTTSPITHIWSDGTAAKEGSSTATTAIYWKKGQTTDVGASLEKEVGYTLAIPAADVSRVLTLVTGLCAADAELLLYAEGEANPAYTHMDQHTQATATYTKHTIHLRRGQGMTLVYRMQKKNAADGCLLLGGAALSELTLSDAVQVTQQKVSNSNNRWNLTEMGDIDWLHLSGTTSQDSSSQLVETRKATDTPQIRFEILEDTTGKLVQNDNAVGYSWTAADAESGQAYDSQPGSSKGLVVCYKNGDASTVGMIPENLEVGARLHIAADDTARVLQFVAGAFQSKSEFSIYLNGKDTPAYQGMLDVEGATTNIYTVKLMAGESAMIELRTIQKRNNYGNLFLGGITLGVDNEGLNLKANLARLVEEMDTYRFTGYTGEAVERFNTELAHAKQLLEQSDVTNQDCYETTLFLQNAFDTLLAYTETQAPDFYNPQTRNWLYFGWENDASKSLSTMGGTLYPGGANGSRNKDVQPIRYTLSMDTTEYKPDETSENRRQNTRWYQADGYMNSPVSEWTAGDTGVDVRIQHVANRVLEDSATVVFTKVTLTNTTAASKTVALNISAPSSIEVPLTAAPTLEGSQFMIYRQEIPASGKVELDFAALATGTATPQQLTTLGSFDDNYAAVKAYYDAMLADMTLPVSLPDQEMVNSYINSMIVMWETMVQASNGDYEIRGDAGNRCGVYNYDRYFTHDVPNMVEQFIRDGYIDLAWRIMESGYYQELAYNPKQSYLDAIPKYIIPYATLWQVMNEEDRATYFTDEIKNAVKDAANNIAAFMTGPDGLMAKSNTLDNGGDYLVVDNFAVMHGYAAYAYLCKEWGWAEQEAWANERAETINNALNSMLDESMERREVDWYMCALEDTSGFWTRYADGSVIYDGNWLGTTFMMSTFPWDAVLRGYDLGGTWDEYLDASMDNAFALKDERGDIPTDSWGAWWGHEYGAVYNVGMSVPLLYSDKYRTLTVKSYEWMLDNQCAPFQWGESFDKGQNDTDWCKPAAGYETWGLGFMRQGLLEATVSVKTDGTVIVGRGIPNEWLTSGTDIAWQNVQINNGRKFDKLTISTPNSKTVKLSLTGDDAVGNIELNLPALMNNIKAVSVGSFDNATGTVTVPADTKELTVTLLQSLDGNEDTHLLGDVNLDGEVAAADALMALQAATGKIVLPEDETAVADVDGTVGVTANDALLILQYATKKITDF